MKKEVEKYINQLTDEIAGFTKDERKEYEESLKNYRDIKNVVDTAREEGEIEGKKKAK